jgi:SAM-dependent methyltransferase
LPDLEEFARFYDRVETGLQLMHRQDPDRFGIRVRDCISRHMPQASSLLDLGCGTGTVLAGLSDLPSLTGLDLSPAMLSIARSKVPAATFIEGDMAAFDLRERFDVVICVFDTLNNLTTFDRWISLFDCVHAHLVNGGIFVFDVLTVEAFRSSRGSPPSVYDFDGNTAIAAGTLAQHDVWVTDFRIFEHLEGDCYRLVRLHIRELAVDLDRITDALTPCFELIEMTDQSGNSPNGSSKRLYFVARKHEVCAPTATSEARPSVVSRSGEPPPPRKGGNSHALDL